MATYMSFVKWTDQGIKHAKDAPKRLDAFKAAVKRVTERINPGRTMFVVSTKSGTTLETLDLYQVFRGLVESGHAPHPGSQFIAITDAGTPLEQLATEATFRRIFLNPASIGGRYSALSFFGLVPATLMGIDIKALLDRGHGAERSSS